MEDSKKVAYAYTIIRYANGDTDVEDAKLEGTTEMSSEDIYKDIEEVSKIISIKRVENAAYAGVLRFYQDVERRQAEAARTSSDDDALSASK